MSIVDLGSKVINEHGIIAKRSAITYVTEDETIPDPEFLSVLGQFLIVRPVSISEKIKGKNNFSLIMPETVKEHTQYMVAMGKVIGVGEKSGARDGVSKLSIGDYIIFPKNSGDFIKVNGVRCVVMYDDVPIAKVDPEKIKFEL